MTRYDTNIQLVPNGESDMVYLVGPRIGIKYEGPDATVTAGYRVNAELFATHPSLNRVRQEISVDAVLTRMMRTVLPKGSTLHVRENLYYTPILPDFESWLTPSPDGTTGGVRTPRTNTFRNVFEIDESMPVSLLTRVEFGYKNSYTQYQDPGLIDSQMNEVTITFNHDLSRIDTTTTGYSYRRFNPFGGEVTHLHTLSLGDQHQFSPILKGEAWIRGIAAVLPGFNKPQYSVHGGLGVTRQFKNQTTLSLRWTQYIDAASGISSVPLNSDRVSFSITKNFTPALSGEGTLDLARNYSLVKDQSNNLPVDIYSQGTNVGLHYQLTSWLMSDLEYRYFRQESTVNSQAGLSRNIYGFALRGKWS